MHKGFAGEVFRKTADYSLTCEIPFTILPVIKVPLKRHKSDDYQY